ncbi:MAG: circadian clock protein KaiC [Candidatus Hydrogenedentes bacterium]|nr:circadian clock protein KaiC [Candidatus Hydrogenedentota bacterium]
MDTRRKAAKTDAGVAKASTGVLGLDEILLGGIPSRRTTLLLGGPGAGKTVLALQSLLHAAELHQEPGVFVAFEENSDRILQNANGFDWNTTALQDGRVVFMDAGISSADAQVGAFDLEGLLAAIGAKAGEIGAKRVVFDGIDMLLGLLNDAVAERREVLRLNAWLARTGLTGIVTGKSQSDQPQSLEPYEFLQFMADCVVYLHRRISGRTSERGLRVLKYRGSGFFENECPLSIGPHGVTVAFQGRAATSRGASTTRISSGIQRLDAMLEGGFYRGSTVLVSGNPGTAKTSLCGAFTDAACARGERVLYVGLDESGNELVRNLKSIDVNLEPHQKRGVLRIHSPSAVATSPQEHFVAIQRLIEDHQPEVLVVDPLSAVLKYGGESLAMEMWLRLRYLCEERQITTMVTSLLDVANPDSESTDVQVSTVADTWIHLTYTARGGERNRALTIIKSRGTQNSNQVRELVLSKEGISLADVYLAEGEVLMGSARWEKELTESTRNEQRVREIAKRQRQLELAKSEIEAQIQVLQQRLELQRLELENIVLDQEAELRQDRERHAGLSGRRGADPGAIHAKRTGAKRAGRKPETKK